MKNLLCIILFSLLAFPAWGAKSKWETWENCTLYDDEDANDGDSFKLRKENATYVYVMRLYFVDAPETDNRYPDRVKEQAAYWGISETSALKIGKEATKFSKKFLSKPFTVYTQKEDARGQSKKNRYYCMIESGDEFLSTALVENGLARVFGRQTDPPKGVPSQTSMRLRHKEAEKKAKKNKAGGWGVQEHESIPQEPAPLKPQTIQATSWVTVFSLKNPSRMLGRLKAGATIEILGEEANEMVRIRFKGKAGKRYEAQCRRGDLGL